MARRDKKDVPQAEMARRLGVGVQTVTLTEGGKTTPSNMLCGARMRLAQEIVCLDP